MYNSRRVTKKRAVRKPTMKRKSMITYRVKKDWLGSPCCERKNPKTGKYEERKMIPRGVNKPRSSNWSYKKIWK